MTENPKDALGAAKPPISAVPCPVIFEIGAGMLEGECKYGRHNVRVAAIRASIYYDAAMRHIMDWWEGEDIDPKSGIHHIGKALSCLVVLRDGQMNEMIEDDRPPRARAGWMDRTQKLVTGVLDRHPKEERVPPYTQVGIDATIPIENRAPLVTVITQREVHKVFGRLPPLPMIGKLVTKAPTDKELHDPEESNR